MTMDPEKKRLYQSEIKRLYVDEGYSINKLAHHFKRTNATMIHHIKQLGVLGKRELKQTHNKTTTKVEITNKNDEIIYGNLNKGKMYKTYLKKQEMKETDLSKWYSPDKGTD